MENMDMVVRPYFDNNGLDFEEFMKVNQLLPPSRSGYKCKYCKRPKKDHNGVQCNSYEVSTLSSALQNGFSAMEDLADLGSLGALTSTFAVAAPAPAAPAPAPAAPAPAPATSSVELELDSLTPAAPAPATSSVELELDSLTPALAPAPAAAVEAAADEAVDEVDPAADEEADEAADVDPAASEVDPAAGEEADEAADEEADEDEAANEVDPAAGADEEADEEADEDEAANEAADSGAREHPTATFRADTVADNIEKLFNLVLRTEDLNACTPKKRDLRNACYGELLQTIVLPKDDVKLMKVLMKVVKEAVKNENIVAWNIYYDYIDKNYKLQTVAGAKAIVKTVHSQKHISSITLQERMNLGYDEGYAVNEKVCVFQELQQPNQACTTCLMFPFRPNTPPSKRVDDETDQEDDQDQNGEDGRCQHCVTLDIIGCDTDMQFEMQNAKQYADDMVFFTCCFRWGNGCFSSHPQFGDNKPRKGKDLEDFMKCLECQLRDLINKDGAAVTWKLQHGNYDNLRRCSGLDEYLYSIGDLSQIKEMCVLDDLIGQTYLMHQLENDDGIIYQSKTDALAALQAASSNLSPEYGLLAIIDVEKVMEMQKGGMFVKKKRQYKHVIWNPKPKSNAPKKAPNNPACTYGSKRVNDDDYECWKIIRNSSNPDLDVKRFDYNRKKEFPRIKNTDIGSTIYDSIEEAVEEAKDNHLVVGIQRTRVYEWSD
jgi:hypothetical protein